MTSDELRVRAAGIMQQAIGMLKQDGSVLQVFFIYTTEPATEIMPMPGWVTNNGRMKQLMARMLHNRVKAGDVEAVFMISDMFISSKVTKEVFDEIERRGLNAEEAAAAGLCESHEALFVMAETPLTCMQLRQIYRRPDPDNPEKVELLGEPEELTGGSFHGRFANYWPEPKSVQ